MDCDIPRVIPPQGAFYFFLDFRSLNMTSIEICERILEEAGYILVEKSFQDRRPHTRRSVP